MADKPKTKSWLEIQTAIAAISMTATLGLWNMFAAPDQAKAAEAAKLAPTATPEPTPTEVVEEEVEPTPASMSLVPVKIIFGGEAPQQQVVQVQASGAGETKAKKKKSGGGGGGGGGGETAAPPPAPPVTTGSS